MRIVAGLHKGRRLQVPKNNAVRPTTDKVRGAVFNMLEARGAVQGARVIDAFCGSGALGLEAMSRGAEYCMFVDKARSSLSLAQENANLLGVEGRFFLKDFTKMSPRDETYSIFDLVFLDPPYGKGLVDEALRTVLAGDWIAQNAYCVCETEKAYDVPLLEGFILEDRRVYGDIAITILRYQPIVPV